MQEDSKEYMNNFEKWPAEQQQEAATKVMIQYELDQILLRDKYQIFPNQKRLEFDQYKKISKNLDKLTFMNSRAQVCQSLAAESQKMSEEW